MVALLRGVPISRGDRGELRSPNWRCNYSRTPSLARDDWHEASQKL